MKVVMKKNQQARVVPMMGKSRNARRRRRIKEAEREIRMTDPRWGLSLGLDKMNFPGFSLGGGKLSIGSRNDGLDTVGVAPYAYDVQVVMPRVTTEQGGKYGTMDVLAGTEYLASIATVSAADPGDILFEFLINPTNFVKTRLSQFAPLYQRYRFRKLNFCYEPAASALTNGQIIGYGDYDPDNLLPGDNPDNVQVAAAHMGERVSKLWEAKVFPFGIADDYTSLFCALGDQEARLIYQGVFYLLCSSYIAPATTLGNLYVDYEVEFMIPQLSITTVDTGTQVLSLTNTSVITSAPLGTSVAELSVGLPANNLTYSYAQSLGTSSVIVNNMPGGQYLIVFGPIDGISATISSVTGGSAVYTVTIPSVGVEVLADSTVLTSGAASAYTMYGNEVDLIEIPSGSHTFNLSVTVSGGATWNPPTGTSAGMQFILVSVGALTPTYRRMAKFLKKRVKIVKGHIESDVTQDERVPKPLLALSPVSCLRKTRGKTRACCDCIKCSNCN